MKVEDVIVIIILTICLYYLVNLAVVSVIYGIIALAIDHITFRISIASALAFALTIAEIFIKVKK